MDPVVQMAFIIAGMLLFGISPKSADQVHLSSTGKGDL